MTTCYTRIRLILGFFVLLLAAGCAAHNLREAQDHFNKGSEMELRAMDRTLLSDSPEALPGDAVAALNEYRLAYNVATTSIKEKSGELRKDNLLGTAYILKAMSLWRISDLEGNPMGPSEDPSNSKELPVNNVSNSRQELLSVLSQIQTLQEKNEIALGTRDKVLHKALYGFYDHDGGRVEKDYSKARNWFNSAYEQMKSSLTEEVPERHPVRIYIGSAQLRTLAAWDLAIYTRRKHCGKEEDTQKRTGCIKSLDADDNTIKKNAEDTVCSLRLFWDNNEGVKDSLRRILVTIGLPGVLESCP